MKALATCVLLLFVEIALAQGTATPPAATPPAVVASPSAANFDAVAATRAFMNRLQGEAREKSDAYMEGGYWLQLWGLLYGLVVAWLLLSRRISLRIREFAERKTSSKNLQALIYVLVYVPLTALLSLPLAFYEGHYREHQYGLSNLSAAGWFRELGIGLGVSMVLSAIAFTGMYAILRRAPRTWWAWGTVAGAAMLVVVLMISPVFIDPLFNTYKPLPEGPIRADILSLARANGIPADNVYYFDASKQTNRISANVAGMFGTTRIALNDNLLERTSPSEIRAVMAHEMGHYVLNHIFKHVVALTLLLMLGLLFIRYSWTWATARFGSRFGVRDIADPAGLPLLAALFSVFLFVATPVYNTIIRTAEVEADLFGLNASREPDGFAEAIFKLAQYRKLEPGPVEEFLLFHHPSGYNRILAAMRWKAENNK